MSRAGRAGPAQATVSSARGRSTVNSNCTIQNRCPRSFQIADIIYYQNIWVRDVPNLKPELLNGGSEQNPKINSSEKNRIMMNQRHQVFLEEWEPSFQTRSYSYKSKPIEDRKCRDVCCVSLLIIVLMAFLGLGVYSLVHGISKIDLPSPAFINTSIILVLTVGLAMGLSVVLALLLKYFPEVMIYLMMVAVGVILTTIAVVCFIDDGVAMGVLMLLALFVYLLLIGCCFNPYIATTIILAKISSSFLKQRPCTYGINFALSLLSLCFVVFWLGQYLVQLQTTSSQVLSLTTLFLLFFLCYILYYSSTFLVSVQAAHWYHRRYSSASLALKWLLTRQIGSITFASLMITIVKLARMMSNQSDRHDNTCKKVCTCLVKYCLCMLEGFLKTMNHYAVIMTALTGEDFVNSAKSAGVLIFSNMGLFTIVEMIDSFLVCLCLIVCVGVPTLLCEVVMPLFEKQNMAVMATISTICCLLVAIMPLIAFVEGMCAIFTYFCVNRKLLSYGVKIQNLPEELFERFKKAFSGHEQGAALAEEDYVYSRRATTIIPPSTVIQDHPKTPKRNSLKSRTSIVPIFQSQPLDSQQTVTMLYHHPVLYDRSTRQPVSYRNV